MQVITMIKNILGDSVDHPNVRAYITQNFSETGEIASNYWVKLDKSENLIKVFKNKEDTQELAQGLLKENGVIEWRKQGK